MLKIGLLILIIWGGNWINIDATPKKEVLEKYKKELSQEIELKFKNTSVMEILDYIKKKSAFTIVIEEKNILDEMPLDYSKFLKRSRNSKVKSKRKKNRKELHAESIKEKNKIDYSIYKFPMLTFNYKAITIRDTLLWLVDLTDLDFEISDKGIRISTKETLIKPFVKLKIYDFSSVFYKPINFISPSITNGGIHDRSGDGGMVFEDSDDENTIGAQSIEDVIEILKSNIIDGHWDLNSTKIYAYEGMLYVENTAEVHAKVKKMMGKVQNVFRKQVVIDFKFIKTPVDALDKFFDKSSSGIFLTNAAYQKLVLTEIPTIKDAVEICSSRIVCFNDQEVFTFSGRAETNLLDYNISDSVADPETKASFTKGFDFQIHPLVSFDSKQINLNLRTNFILNARFIPHEIKIQSQREHSLGIKLDGDLTGSGKSKKNDGKKTVDIDGNVKSKGTFYIQPGIKDKYGKIYKMQKDLCHYRQSLKLENGGAVILKRTSGKRKNSQSYYLILQAQTIETHE
ncbi:MAG: hypothetical protein COA79_08855 [Planctomycetota bacterium]|nr:MAG: hypothetical protein COA79_08855 [Planctomycetota bacterium]